MGQQAVVKLLLYSIFGLLIAGILGFLAIGVLSSPVYEGEVSAELSVPKRFVWKYLTEIDSLPEYREDVERIEILGLNELNLERWREYTDSKGFLEKEFREKVPDSKVAIRVSRSSFGMTGSWTYYLSSEEENKCNIKIVEKSTAPGLVSRAMMTLGGRDSYLKNQIQLIKTVYQKKTTK